MEDKADLKSQAQEISFELEELIDKATEDLRDKMLADSLINVNTALIEFCEDYLENTDGMHRVLRAARRQAKHAKKYMDDLNELFDNYVKQYQPAESIYESNSFVSTEELILAFSSVITVNKDTVYMMMKKRGCILAPNSGRFVWLLKED